MAPITQKDEQNNLAEDALALHRKLRGKIEIALKVPLTQENLKFCYTPGVGAVVERLVEHPEETPLFTMQGNSAGIITNGTATLGYGDTGPKGASPVMEGKCMICKACANIDAFPIMLATKDPREIIETIVNIAPSFGAILLEDIKAPECFDIEDELKRRLPIPVFHDDQHGTAIVVLAGLINAFRVVEKDIKRGKIAIVGAGAAGAAVARILLRFGIEDVTLLDRKGIIGAHRADLIPYKRELARITNSRGLTGGLPEALTGVDVVIGVSGSGLITAEHVSRMANDAIVFALANPIPEIMPSEALRGGARVVATGRSDHLNQINNALVFPGLLRGALDRLVRQITDAMKIRAAEALARLVPNPTPACIVPSLFKEPTVLDERVPRAVAEAIR